MNNKQKIHDLSLIIFHLKDKGYRVTPRKHIGKGIYEIEYDDSEFLSGACYLGEFKIVEDKVKHIKSKLLWMS